MANRPTDEQLALVVHHGSGPIERALATVRLTKRHERLDDLQQLVEDAMDKNNGGVEH